MKVKLEYEVNVESIDVYELTDYDEEHEYGIEYGYLEIRLTNELIFIAPRGHLITTNYIRYEVDIDDYEWVESKGYKEYIKALKEADIFISNFINGNVTDDELLDLPFGCSSHTAFTLRDLPKDVQKEVIKMLRKAIIEYQL